MVYNFLPFNNAVECTPLCLIYHSLSTCKVSCNAIEWFMLYMTHCGGRTEEVPWKMASSWKFRNWYSPHANACVRDTLFAFILTNMVLELQQLPLLKTFQMVSESVLDQLLVATSMGFECPMGKPHLNMPLNGNIKCFIENMCLPSIVHSHVTFKYLWIRFNLMNWRIWMLLFDAFALFNCQVVALLSHEDSSFYNNLRPKTSESWITCAELVGILEANSHLMKLM